MVKISKKQIQNGQNKYKFKKHKKQEAIKTLKKLINIDTDINNLTRKDFNNKYLLFIPSGNKEFNFSFLQKALENYGLSQADMDSSSRLNLTFIWYILFESDKEDKPTFKTQKSYYNTLCYLSNALDKYNNISEKDLLYLNLRKMFPNEYSNFLAKSFLLTKQTKYNPNDILIAKPVTLLSSLEINKKFQACAGDDIIIINSNSQLTNAQKLLNKYENILVSKYIKNPLLFKTKKFHLRLCFIISIIDSKFNSYLLDTMRIVTAKLPYKLADFKNRDIHDTHLASTEKDYYFPEDFTTQNMSIPIKSEIILTLWDKIRDIMKKVAMVACNSANHIKLYNNHKNAFHMFGPDIMIDENFNPILLEVNSHPTFKRVDNTNTFLDEKVFNLIDDVILHPTFLPDAIHKPKSSNMAMKSLYSRKMENIY